MGLWFQFGSEYASSFYVVSPEQTLLANGKSMTTRMSITTEDDVAIYRSNSDSFATWIQVCSFCLLMV